MPVKYRIRHITEYKYASRVSHCYNLAHMMPRNTQRQTCNRQFTQVEPFPSFTDKRTDYFGNTAFHFEIQKPHKKLIINAETEVSVNPQASVVNGRPEMTCADAQNLIATGTDAEILFAKEYLFNSPMVKVSDELRAYAQPSFEADKPLISAVEDLTKRIFEDFEYNPASTTVATPIAKVMEQKSGVCQDFAHLQVGCLRALGYPAKYVSGYIETLPAPGETKLVGTDASHAWISVYIPNEGWFEFDPTNNQIASEQHIITAWGRDYYDVTPLQGVIFGGGENPLLTISVDVARMESA